MGKGEVDGGFSIALDGAAGATLAGYMFSADFPTTVGAFDTTYNGGEDAVVAKLNNSGSALSYSTYIGGSDYDEGDGIALVGPGSATSRD